MPDLLETLRGVQVHIFRENSLAFYVPHTKHTLNLVGMKAVEHCAETVNTSNFFTIFVFVFLSVCHRWGSLCSKMFENDKHLFHLKCVSLTHYVHAEASKALALNYKCVLKCHTVSSDLENGKTKRDVRSFMKEMRKQETGMVCLIRKKSHGRFTVTVWDEVSI
jgi:hypothetical protein